MTGDTAGDDGTLEDHRAMMWKDMAPRMVCNNEDLPVLMVTAVKEGNK